MESKNQGLTESRKMDHIDICLNEEVRGRKVTTGLERYRFHHNALPEIDFADVNPEASFLNMKLKVPLLVSSMTGGTAEAARINRRLAEMAQSKGWALGVGSVRAAIERKELASTFAVRQYAPSIPILANLGAVQLNYGYGPDQCRQAVDIVEADGLVFHLNALQELFQPEGNTNFKHLLNQIAKVCRALEVPVGVKEVGWGVNGKLAVRLRDAGIRFIDAAGAGGTSWSQVEKHRSKDEVRRKAAETFAEWGIPTAECIREIAAAQTGMELVGSGGITNGLEAAKAVALGANLAGMGRSLLSAAVHSSERLEMEFDRVELELKAAMFGIGAATIDELRGTEQLRFIG